MMLTNSLFVDTSGWAAPVVRDTPSYQELEAFSRSIVTSNRPLVTTNYIIAELVALLTIRTHLSRPEFLHFVNQIKPLAHIVYVDAASFVIMRQLGIAEAFTTDQHFIQAGFIRVPMQ